MLYLLELFLNAVRITLRSDSGTASNSSFPGYISVSMLRTPLERVKTHEVDDFTELNLDATFLQIGVPRRVVN